MIKDCCLAQYGDLSETSWICTWSCLGGLCVAQITSCGELKIHQTQLTAAEIVNKPVWNVTAAAWCCLRWYEALHAKLHSLFLCLYERPLPLPGKGTMHEVCCGKRGCLLRQISVARGTLWPEEVCYLKPPRDCCPLMYLCHVTPIQKLGSTTAKPRASVHSSLVLLMCCSCTILHSQL